MQRRFQNGRSLDLAYTWSKSIQTAYAQTFTRAPSAFDVPQRVAASYVYDLPFGKGKPFLTQGVGAAVLGGWRTSGVYTFSSGLPFSVTSGSDYSNALDAYGAATALPNVVGAPQVLGNIGCCSTHPPTRHAGRSLQTAAMRLLRLPSGSLETPG